MNLYKLKEDIFINLDQVVQICYPPKKAKTDRVRGPYRVTLADGLFYDLSIQERDLLLEIMGYIENEQA